MTMAEIRYGRGYVYSIQYHIVWCVKYRRRVLLGEVEKDLKKAMIEIAGNYGVTIVEMETDQDHIHLLVECTPQHYIPDILKTLKGVSARRLFQLHPEIKQKLWGGHLWNPSYFVATVSEHTENQIRTYIQNQQQK